MMRVGKIVGVHGSFASGLVTLILRDGDEVAQVYAEAGMTMRAFHDAFGREGPLGKEIEYSVDGMGVLEGFTPQ